MNFQALEDVIAPVRSPGQEVTEDRLLDYLEDKIANDACGYLTVELIAEENKLTPTEILEIGADPSSLIYLMAHRLNSRMIQKFCTTYLFAIGFSSLERINKYLLRLFEFDIENIKLRGAIHQYAWSFNKTQANAINNQAMRLLAPIYLEFHENQIEHPDARCHSIWGLYSHALRLSATQGASAQDCLNEIQDAITLIWKK